MTNTCLAAHSSKLCILHLQRYQKQLPFSNLIVWAMIRDSVGRKWLYSLLVLLATEFGMPLQNVSNSVVLEDAGVLGSNLLLSACTFVPSFQMAIIFSQFIKISHHLAFIHPSLFYHWNIILGLIFKKARIIIIYVTIWEIKIAFWRFCIYIWLKQMHSSKV